LERCADRHGLDGLLELYEVQEGEFPVAPEQKAFALMNSRGRCAPGMVLLRV
jgi:hypothetical protein